MYKASFGAAGGAGAGGAFSIMSSPNLPWEFQQYNLNQQGQMMDPNNYGPGYTQEEPWGIRVKGGEDIPEDLVEATMNGLGYAIPDEYKLSPLEYYGMDRYPIGAPQTYMGGAYPVTMPKYVDFSGVGLTKEEAGSWFKRNWKWLAIGAGGLLAVGIVVKIVL